jgi:hypothetical protein
LKFSAPKPTRRPSPKTLPARLQTETYHVKRIV